MTLSSFLKDYLYFPLGGSRNKRKWRTYLNIMIVFILCGLWHGAGWMFIIWGALHGVALCINRLWKNTKIVLPDFICWAITFIFVNIAWIFFRATNLNGAKELIKAMFGANGFYLPEFSKLTVFFDVNDNLEHSWGLLKLILLIILIFVIFIGKLKPSAKILKLNVYYLVSLSFMLVCSLLVLTKSSYVSPFLYFNF